MPFALILIAAIFIVTGFKGTTGDFLSQLKGDVGQVVVPFVAILVIGAIGYIPGFKKLSDLFLALVLLVMFLTNGKNGFFTKFNSEIRNITAAQPSSSTSGNVSLGMPAWNAANTNDTSSLRLEPLPLLAGAGSLAVR